MESTKLKISIGDWSQEYQLWETRAPQGYDGFGTLQIYSCNEDNGVRRYVLIGSQHVEWQTMRYRSGLFGCQPSDEMTASDLTQTMADAFLKPYKGIDS
jgi:hypothetical protein